MYKICPEAGAYGCREQRTITRASGPPNRQPPTEGGLSDCVGAVEETKTILLFLQLTVHKNTQNMAAPSHEQAPACIGPRQNHPLR